MIGAEATTLAHALVLSVEASLTALYVSIATELRCSGLNVEVYAGEDTLGKQLKYADRAKIPVVIIVGSREQEAGVIKLKDLRQGAEVEELDVPRGELVAAVRRLLASSLAEQRC